MRSLDYILHSNIMLAERSKNTLAWCMHLKPHNRMQIQLATISMSHAATNFFVENAELSLQLLIPGHMPRFLQQSHTTDKKRQVKS